METDRVLTQVRTPFYGTIKGSIQIHRNKYGSDDVLTLCCIKVTLLDADNQWVAEECTDDNGDFTFLGFALKTYTVVFPESITYQKQNFLPDGGFQHHFKIELSPEKTIVDGITMHYGLLQTGSVQGYTLGSDAHVNA